MIKHVSCSNGACTKSARYVVGVLEVCGRHVTWGLDWSGVNDFPSYGVGQKKVTVQTHAGWVKENG